MSSPKRQIIWNVLKRCNGYHQCLQFGRSLRWQCVLSSVWVEGRDGRLRRNNLMVIRTSTTGLEGMQPLMDAHDFYGGFPHIFPPVCCQQCWDGIVPFCNKKLVELGSQNQQLHGNLMLRLVSKPHSNVTARRIDKGKKWPGNLIFEYLGPWCKKRSPE